MSRRLRHTLVLALVAVAATRTSASSKAAAAATPPAAAATPLPSITTTTTTTKRGLGAHLHLPHMHAPHLQIPKGGFLFAPFRHQGGAHGTSVIPTGSPPPATAAGASVHDLSRPHPAGSVNKVGATGSVLSSSPAGGDASQPRSSNGEQQDANNTNGQRYPHLHMKTLFQSLRSWTAFKQYCRGVRDLILIARPLESFLLRTGTIHDRDLSRFIARAIAFVAFTMIITSILGTMGLDTKPIIAGLGVSGFIVGFALKEIATNVLSGILLVFQRPFRTGWKIKVGSYQGTVLSIDSRYVRLLTDEDAMILVPAYQVFTQAITVLERKDKSGKVIHTSGTTAGAGATTAPPAAGAAGVKSTPPSR